MHRKSNPYASGSRLRGLLFISIVAIGCGRDKDTTAPPAAATAATAAKAPALKVGFAYGGPVTDAGWTFSHDLGRKALETEFSGKVGTSFVENVADPDAAKRAIADLIARGNALIFGTSMNHIDAMLEAATASPDVKFEQISGGGLITKNLSSYEARGYEGAYLAGIVAGKMTKSNILGMVASHPVPEVTRNINSFTLGAQSVNKTVKTKVAFVNSFFDPQSEAGQAQALLDQGADVLFQTTDSTAVVATAEKAGKLAIGWNANMGKAGPHAHLASVVFYWGPYYEQRAKAALDGSWKPGSAWLGIKEGAVDLVAMDNHIPPDAVEKIKQAVAGLKDGSFNPWTGPISDQTGKEILAAGQKANDDFLRAVHVYVRGVEAMQ
jgi:basic membrane protein A and related proteins